MSDISANLAVGLLARGADDSAAVIHRDSVLTYRELRQKVEDLACDLLALGTHKGDRIGLRSDNVPFFVLGYLATLRAGLCSVPFPPGTDKRVFFELIQSAGIKHVLAQDKYKEKTANWCQAAGIHSWPESEICHPFPRTPRDTSALDRINLNPDSDLAAIMFTSGSTGRPKGVMVTHRNIEANTKDIVTYMELTREDRVLAVLPFSYCFGLSSLHTHLWAGASVVLASTFMFPEKSLDELEDKECTGFAGVPSSYQILLRRTRFAARRFPKLRWLQQAGGKLPAPILGELRAAQPAVKIFVMYGQTEATARLSYLPPELLELKEGSIGRGLPSTKLEVIQETGEPVRPGSEEIGEIVGSGPNISPGYWNDPEETAAFFRNGKLYTGDLARVDKDGFIYIVDRARDFIKCMGNRVSPQEIEEVIAGHPDVLHAAVTGVPDDLWGEAIAAFVVPRKPGLITENAIRRFCNERLPNFKVPHQVSILPGLPFNDHGKVAKCELRSLALKAKAGERGDCSSDHQREIN
ncbi:MAG: AMP-dependent synthetase [Candidatus Abyssobacteria bacterium SURF_17]|uniref:AMP-dependent synthetase n=1 Tax=Candidatus Abyssobacteria bacterium SURF_17 TaxID=2093361 RepID=A0A419F0J7_9BACT|nr:MAG: AMP-dependent synthetase [Candidatus Abyssubacteria bacterium SURF_17]